MKKSISTGMFLLGLIIWTGIIDFLIELPFASILNTEDYVPASVTSWIKVLIVVVALFVSVFIGCKRYIVPASTSKLAFWMATIYFIFGISNLLILPLALGSSKVLAFVSAQAVVSVVISSVLVGGAAYVALRFFSQSNSSSIAR